MEMTAASGPNSLITWRQAPHGGAPWPSRAVTAMATKCFSPADTAVLVDLADAAHLHVRRRERPGPGRRRSLTVGEAFDRTLTSKTALIAMGVTSLALVAWGMVVQRPSPLKRQP